MTPAERATTRARAHNVRACTLEIRIESALRRNLIERATILADVLAERRARAAYRRRSPRVVRDRPVRMVAAWRPIIDNICARHGLKLREVISDYQATPLVAARHELWWTIRQRGVSFPEISRRLGGFDHSTVMYGVRQWAKKMEQQDGMAA